MVLSSVDLISNIGLITAEVLTGETNEKKPTFNKEPSHINNEADIILVGDFCDFEKTMVYRRGILVKRHKYMQSTSDRKSAIDQIKSSDVPISTGYRWKLESINFKNCY